MRKITVIIALFLAAIQIVSAQKVGLVLSGGGAKGAAHIGVIKALEENNIPIDYITGTSIGAIIGSLYAMGYSPEEMLELMLSKEFSYWQTGTVEEQYTYYFKEPYPTPEFAHFSIDMSDSLQIKASFLPQSLINPIQMNQAFMALFSQATAKAGWNFDNLFVPFRCVASDIYTKKPIIFKNGDLGDAVRASMTFPFFFQPIWKDSIPLFDGGIYDNFPVGPMKDAFHPDFIFGSTVSGGNKKPSENPYNQIETMIMQKTDYEEPEEKAEFIDLITKNSDLLLKLINDILDLSRIESGSMSFSYENLDLSKLMGDIFHTHQLMMPEGVELKIRVPHEPLIIRSDHFRLTQVCTNFINNAVKFTAKGYIEIGYELSADGKSILISVKDTGKGIPDDKKEKVFERFQKLDEFAQGTGLGLAICQSIVHTFHGSISLESEVGVGSKFTISLPYTPGLELEERT